MEGYPQKQVSERVNRLWALPASLMRSLIARGISVGSIAEAAAALDQVDAVVTPSEAIAASFHPRTNRQPPFRPGRFSDGSFPVFYSAQDEATCIEELRFKLIAELAIDTHARHFEMLNVQYSGLTMELCGHEIDHPELVSPTNSGYPFCQHLAVSARNGGINAMHAPSARCKGGVCVPIFSESCLSDPNIVGEVTFSMGVDGQVIARNAAA